MSFLDAYLDFTAHQETTERIHRWVGITAIAGALERRVWLNRGHYTLFPNLYTFIIGPSGKVKKSTSTAIGVDLLRDLPDFKIMSERLTAASLISQLERSQKTFEWKGHAVKQSPSFAYASELNVFLGEVFGSISELLTTFYDCVPHDSSKPWVYDTKMSGTSRIFGPCLSFLGASTPAWLVRSIPPSEMEGGFASRVIFVFESESRRSIAWPDEVLPGDAHEQKRRFIASQLKRIYELKGPFRVTQELRRLGQAWYEQHERSAKPDPRFSGYYARKFDTVLKVSMALSVSDNDALILDTSHFEHALSLLNDVESRMFEAFGAFGENPNAPIMERVWKVICLDDGIPLQHLIALMRRDANLPRIMEVVEHLRAMGRIARFMDDSRRDLVLKPIDPHRPL